MGSSPALGPYAIFSTVLALHMILLALWTGTVRTLRKAYVNPEDGVVIKGGTQGEADHPDVQRVKRAHQNALENAVPFFAIGLLYAITAPSKKAAMIYFGTFTAARILHSLFYLWGRQPYRTLMFAVGVMATIGMGVHVLRMAL